jgi:hypothetical protein
MGASEISVLSCVLLVYLFAFALLHDTKIQRIRIANDRGSTRVLFLTIGNILSFLFFCQGSGDH